MNHESLCILINTSAENFYRKCGPSKIIENDVIIEFVSNNNLINCNIYSVLYGLCALVQYTYYTNKYFNIPLSLIKRYFMIVECCKIYNMYHTFEYTYNEEQNFHTLNYGIHKINIYHNENILHPIIVLPRLRITKVEEFLKFIISNDIRIKGEKVSLSFID